jgi:integrase
VSSTATGTRNDPRHRLGDRHCYDQPQEHPRRIGPVSRRKRAPKQLPLDGELLGILREWQRDMLRDQAPGLKDGWCFPGRTGELRAPSSLTKAWAGALEEIGLPGTRFTMHGLRRTFNESQPPRGRRPGDHQGHYGPRQQTANLTTAQKAPAEVRWGVHGAARHVQEARRSGAGDETGHVSDGKQEEPKKETITKNQNQQRRVAA